MAKTRVAGRNKMGADSYQWQTPVVGMALSSGTWVLSRRLEGRTAGEQWLASNPENSREVIIYLPTEAIVRDEALFDEWVRRTTALKTESSAVFQRVLAVETKAVDWPYAVLEFVDGLDLKHFRLSLENRSIPLSQLKGWLKPVSEALTKAHQEKRFHRSLTPEALVLNREGEIRVLHHGWQALFCDLEQRASGELAGSLPIAYLSPQQLDGRRARATDDVYSFAATIYELVASQPPFVSGDLLYQIRQVQPDSLRERIEDLGEDPDRVPENLDQAIARCLAKTPSERFQSIRDFWRAAWGTQPIAQPVSPTEPEVDAVEGEGDQGVGDRDRNVPAPGAKLPMAKIPEIVPDDDSGEEDLPPTTAGPYVPAPPMTSDKRFGVVFGFIVLIGMVVVGFAIDQWRDSKIQADPNATGDALLSRSIPSISTNLSTYDEFAALVETPENVGWLSVRTEPVPAIAELWLNTQEIPVEQVTPTVFSNLPPGEIELRLVALGYVVTNLNRSIVAGETNWVSVNLQVESRLVSLSSEPDGVRYVLSRGEREIRSGTCPDEFPLRVGFYQLEYQLGDRTKTTYLRVNREASNESSVVFESGKLSVETNPEEAEVYLGAKLAGMTPLTVTNLPPGNHRVTIKAPRHRGLVLSANIEKDIETFVSKTLEPMVQPEAQEEWVNSLGMRFVPVESDQVLFGVYEVTRQEFRQFVQASGASMEVSEAWKTLEGEVDQEVEPKLPVTHVSWGEADAFCRWLTEHEQSKGLLGSEQQYRIPDDSEWDLAVAELSAFPWGIWPPTRGVGNYGTIRYGEEEAQIIVKDPYPGLAPVGQFNENRFGLFDLGGNVREWCSMSGNSGSDKRMVRGGSYLTVDRSQLASSYRETIPMNSREGDLGFRVLISLGEVQD